MTLDRRSKESAQTGKDGSVLPPAERRRRRRELWISALIIAAVFTLLYDPPVAATWLGAGGGDLFFLTAATVILILLLSYLVTRNFWKLVAERRRGILGSRLNLKFVSAFVLVAFMTTSGLFAVSAYVISSSIDRWFGVRVDRALETSGEVVEEYYEATARHALFFGEQIAEQLADRGLLNAPLGPQKRQNLDAFVRERRRDYNLGSVELFDAAGEAVVAAIGSDIPTAQVASSAAEIVRLALGGAAHWRVEEGGESDVVRAAVPVPARAQSGATSGVVVVNTFTPSSQASRVAMIRTVLGEFRRLQPQVGEMQTVYLLELLLASLVALMLASWMGFRLAKGVTEPIRELAEGTAEVARGNLEVQVSPQSDDEVGFLVESFNRMTRDLRDARSGAEQSAAELERRRRYMEIVLGTIGAGVVSLDANRRISTINPTARRFLGISADLHVIGRKLDASLARRELVEVIDNFEGHLSTGARETICHQVQVPQNDHVATLLVTLAVLHESGARLGTVMVFDDLTQLARVERMAAWREVARRIAHEIKNPLTPIQLSAQRIRRRFRKRLADEPEELAIFDQCLDSISSHVETLKLLVDEFSKFARLPTGHPRPDDLNGIVSEVVASYSGTPEVRFETNLDSGIPPIELDREQLRRAFANLIDNAIAAVERAREGDADFQGLVELRSRYDPVLQSVRIEIADNGVGVSAEDRHMIFEPYFSTKPLGTGLGLAIVAQIVADHRGYVRLHDNEPRGSRFVIELPAVASLRPDTPSPSSEHATRVPLGPTPPVSP